MARWVLLLVLGIAGLRPVWGQPEHSAMDRSDSAPMAIEAAPSPADLRLFSLPHSRHASGTAWMPDSTPMYGMMGRARDWEMMYHGAAHFTYDRMEGKRGDEKFVIPNWMMVLARRKPWKLAAMVSLDPLTVGGGGYPLLFQTGETWNDRPLKDHQHPHNFFSELSATYTHPNQDKSAAYLYLAPVGEPALGPPTFMHRTFALDDALSPIGHHWQDATHIAYGVVTAGYQTHSWQAEFSTFNGREPGENRLAIERPKFDSFSGRLSYNPNPNWALQISHGFLKSPETLHPEENLHRTTASAIYNRPQGEGRNFQASLVWGKNRLSGRDLDSFLLEGQWKRDGGWTPYLRYEQIRKDAEELVLPAFPASRSFPLRQATLGIVKDLPSRGDYQWGIGGQVFFNIVPEALQPIYGKHPLGWLIFVRVHPKQMTAEGGRSGEHH